MARSPKSQSGLLGGPEYHNGDTGYAVSASRAIRHVGPRSRRSKFAWLAAFAVFCMFFVMRPRNPRGGSDIYNDHPTEPQSPIPNVSSGNRNESPSFHLLVRRSSRGNNAGLCRTISSSMLLDYPPLTLVEGESPDNSIAAINDYLWNRSRLKDDDVVLIVDEPGVWFQLPPDLLLKRFYRLLVENNQKLRRTYGSHYRDNNDREPIQTYSQRIIFGADKVCHGVNPRGPACAAVPYSTLMPDIYGPATDEPPDRSNFRPRWLNAQTVMGTVGDMRQLYRRAAELSSERKGAGNEQQILSKVLGQQEYVREMYRLTAARSWLTRLAEVMGIFDRVDISKVQLDVVQGRRYDFGIGLDYKSELFFTVFKAGNDVEWLEFDNVSTLSTAQRDHGVPRESRMILPNDIKQLQSPFMQPLTGTETEPMPPSATPLYHQSIDKIPHPANASWETIPLATNVRTAAIPALLHVNGTNPEDARAFWTSMWFNPWSRALLRRYIRSTQQPEAAVSSLQGGDNSWDSRGGKGGIWTAHDEWKTWPEMCRGFEAGVFGDGMGTWGKEGGIDHEPPVFNQWGMLVRGEVK